MAQVSILRPGIPPLLGHAAKNCAMKSKDPYGLTIVIRPVFTEECGSEGLSSFFRSMRNLKEFLWSTTREGMCGNSSLIRFIAPINWRA